MSTCVIRRLLPSSAHGWDRPDEGYRSALSRRRRIAVQYDRVVTQTEVDRAGDTADDDAVPRLRLAITRLARRLRQHAIVNESITPSRFSALITVHRRGPVRLSDIADAERIGKSTVTRLVAKLERDGLVSRVADPRDGRSALLVATQLGEELLDSTNERADEYLRVRLARLDIRDVATIVAALPAIERLLDIVL
jgi:DNA-binding MarR family transcriptional regulator